MGVRSDWVGHGWFFVLISGLGLLPRRGLRLGADRPFCPDFLNFGNRRVAFDMFAEADTIGNETRAQLFRLECCFCFGRGRFSDSYCNGPTGTIGSWMRLSLPGAW
jgi:hypothetical protein